MGSRTMLVSCSKSLFLGAVHRTPSYSSSACVASLTENGRGRGINNASVDPLSKSGRERGKQRSNQRAALDVSNKDWLAALKAPEVFEFQTDEANPSGASLVETFVGSIVSEDDRGYVDPNVFVLGIDPDVSGAMAVLRGNDVSTAEVFDVPSVRVMIGSQTRRRHDACSIVSMIRNLNAPKGSIAYIEQNIPLPQDGKQGWWGSGFGYGIWIGTLVACGISVIPVSSSVWKRSMGLYGRNFTKVVQKHF
ncbi:hypothetical protein KP509_39G046400 [Ceratopteris richardii]|uniref:Uncharacterized protein n=1 Tax=Ceratopteris richardii TaxID=49495 RepID=A0A8T2Q0Z3_CERRI|nr:hypothetical protein KP509_39G046400 [Ceratopteris richardii]